MRRHYEAYTCLIAAIFLGLFLSCQRNGPTEVDSATGNASPAFALAAGSMPTPPNPSQHGAGSYPYDPPGLGLTPMTKPTTNVYTVTGPDNASAAQQLINAINQANGSSGKTIWINSDLTINLTSYTLPTITKSMTIASGGSAATTGALLKVTQYKHHMFKVTGAGTAIRFTGLRLQGPDGTIGDPNNIPPTNATLSCGIWVVQATITVDNCEVFNWDFCGIGMWTNARGTFHHNYMHHNQRSGWGYGISLSSARAIVEANEFCFNRHSVCGDGVQGDAYTACYNLITEGKSENSHDFDMHGGYKDTSLYAGDSISIYNNTFENPFLNTNPPTPNGTTRDVCIRAIPRNWCKVRYNTFRKDAAEIAVNQLHHMGKMTISSNDYELKPPSNWTGWYTSWRAGSGWYRLVTPYRYGITPQLGDLAIGDFTGDGQSDVFVANGIQWYYAYFNPEQGRMGIATLRSGMTDLRSSLGFGDFTGDGKTDVFKPDGTYWWVSSAGTAAWTKWNQSAVTLTAMLFGDFDGDAKCDVLYTNGTAWKISKGGSGGWQLWNATMPDLASTLRVGDFNGDGCSDVMKATGTQWLVSWNGSGAWTVLNSSMTDLVANLAFGDFNGDGKTDMFRTSGGKWQISSGGTGAWQQVNSSGASLSALLFGDFDGDGKEDVLITGQSM